MAETKKESALAKAKARVAALEKAEHTRKERERLKAELAKLSPKKKAK